MADIRFTVRRGELRPHEVEGPPKRRRGYECLKAFPIGDDGQRGATYRWLPIELLHATEDAARAAHLRIFGRGPRKVRGRPRPRQLDLLHGIGGRAAP